MTGQPVWKEHFPVSWTDDAYITRREFTKSLGLIPFAAFAAVGTMTAVDSFRRASSHACPRVPIDGALNLAPGESLMFNYPEEHDPCLLIRHEDGFTAVSQKCTHLACPVHLKKGSDTLYCPCHAGYFSARDGRVTAGPPRRGLQQITLEQTGEQLWATGLKT